MQPGSERWSYRAQAKEKGQVLTSDPRISHVTDWEGSFCSFAGPLASAFFDKLSPVLLKRPGATNKSGWCLDPTHRRPAYRPNINSLRVVVLAAP